MNASPPVERTAASFGEIAISTIPQRSLTPVPSYPGTNVCTITSGMSAQMRIGKVIASVSMNNAPL